MSRGQRAVPVGNINHDTPEQIGCRMRDRMMRLTHKESWFVGIDKIGDVYHLNTSYTSGMAKIRSGKLQHIGTYSKKAQSDWLADDLRCAMNDSSSKVA